LQCRITGDGRLRMKPLSEIYVPSPAPELSYEGSLGGRSYHFPNLKRLLGAADFAKAGERNAGLQAENEQAREVARLLLSGLSLQHLYEHVLLDRQGRVDAVMRVNYDIDLAIFEEIKGWTVGGLKDRLLFAKGEEIKRIGRGLTGVMVAAVAKLMDVHERIDVSRKIVNPTKARTQLGLKGRLSSRLQPNHPTDDPRGIELLTCWGLSLGAGDAMFGVNPAVDSVENVGAILLQLDRIRRRLDVPTQICVLAHIKTQLACLERGIPVEILFQSIAGTESTLSGEFDVTVELLDYAYRTMAEHGPLRSPQFMYFETGQGSELSYGKHEGIDMTTTEALCYGLARRYDPFMVNNVTGFIGPETHCSDMEMVLSNLQDHFMGKVLGLPMGMAPCYTLHSEITVEGQQVATQLLTAAGATYYMDVALNCDRMLAYFDTSAYDDQSLREVHGKLPTPEYLAWAVARGILTEDGERGPNWGDFRRLLEDPTQLPVLEAATPRLPGYAHAGARPTDAISRRLRGEQAVARRAVHEELDPEQIGHLAAWKVLDSAASSRAAHLNDGSPGGHLAPGQSLPQEEAEVLLVVTDGLSAAAVHENLGELWPLLTEGLESSGYRLATPLLVRRGRVKLLEELLQRQRLGILLIGERPGGDIAFSRSLSAYFAFRPPEGPLEWSVISNVYPGGTPPIEAASLIVEKARKILSLGAAGNRLGGDDRTLIVRRTPCRCPRRRVWCQTGGKRFRIAAASAPEPRWRG
jgi:ethanolamine ammonia-lyase large subunit